MPATSIAAYPTVLKRMATFLKSSGPPENVPPPGSWHGFSLFLGSFLVTLLVGQGWGEFPRALADTMPIGNPGQQKHSTALRPQQDEPSPQVHDLNILPPPIYKVPLVPNQDALVRGLRIWFPEYDGDGFFASFDAKVDSSNSDGTSTVVFQNAILPILKSFGFPSDQQQFAMPKHAGIPLNKVRLNALGKRICNDLPTRQDRQPEDTRPTVSSIPFSTIPHVVHTPILTKPGSENSVLAETETASKDDPDRLVATWADMLCPILEQVGIEGEYDRLDKENPKLFATLDPLFQERTGLTMKKFIENFQRLEYFYFFPQIHRPHKTEFPPSIEIPQAVTIDHAGIRASRREGETVYSATGRVFRSYGVTNRVRLSTMQAAEVANTKLKELAGVSKVEPIPSDWPALVLLPAGASKRNNVSSPGLRYTYRIPAYVNSIGRHLVYLWLDAEEGTILELVSLSSGAGGQARAMGTTLRRNPAPPTEITEFRFDPPPNLNGAPGSPVPSFSLQVNQQLQGNPPDNLQIDNQNLTIPSPGADWNFTTVGDPAAYTPSFEQGEKVDLFSTVYRYLDTVTNAPFTPTDLMGSSFPTSAIKLATITQECDPALLSMYQEDIYLTFGIYDPNRCGNLGFLMVPGKAYHDHTLIAHEMGHLLTLHQYGYIPSPPNLRRDPNWCSRSVFEPQLTACPLPLRPGYVHDFADAWVQVFENTNCVADWMGQWIKLGRLNSSGWKSLFCQEHHEAGGWPRLSSLPDPVNFNLSFYPGSVDANTWGVVNDFFAKLVGDHFPEHRRISYYPGAPLFPLVPDYADMQIASAALWEVRVGARSFGSIAGGLSYFTRFVRTLATTGWLGIEYLNNLCPSALTYDDPTCRRAADGYSDRDVYRGLVDLEIKLANQWTTHDATSHLDRTVNKVASGFARAGIFMIPPACLDGDYLGDALMSCTGGKSGGDAVIDIDDNDCLDDWIDGWGDPCYPSSITGVLHQDRDHLKYDGPVPSFHVWTGPRYGFSGRYATFDPSGEPPCNNKFMVEVADDEAFLTAHTTSGWLETSPTSPCYFKWTPTDAEWTNIVIRLQTQNFIGLQPQNTNRLYYRVTTCKVPPGSGTPCLIFVNHPGAIYIQNQAASHIRYSTSPANGLFGHAPPPYAIVENCGGFFLFVCVQRQAFEVFPSEFRRDMFEPSAIPRRPIPGRKRDPFH